MEIVDSGTRKPITGNIEKGDREMTTQELHDEFWLLTKSILQDSKIDTTEARVLKRWLEEHQQGDEFAVAIGRLSRILEDGYVDRFESKEAIKAFGDVLVWLGTSS